MLRARMTRKLAVISSIAVLAFAAVSVAAAAPAQTTSIRECYPDTFGTLDGTICYTIHSVEKPGTDTKENGSMLIEFFDADGNLVFSDKTQWHTTVIEKGDHTQVYHDKTKVRTIEGGLTCTNGTNTVFANGEIRHLGPEWEWVCK